MNIIDAQTDMKNAYYRGGPAVLVSGLVWITSGIIAASASSLAGMLTLFFGAGMIFPISMGLSKLLKRSGAHQKDNPLGKFSLETTVLLFSGMFIAFAVSTFKLQWFFPIMLLMIGSRYFMFSSIYNTRLYWSLGGVLILAGALFIIMSAPVLLSALTGGAVELIFSVILMLEEKKAGEKN